LFGLGGHFSKRQARGSRLAEFIRHFGGLGGHFVLDFGGKNELAVLFREKDFLIMRIVKSKINCYITYMGQKGFVNIIMVIIGVIVFAGAAGYFIVRQRTPSPAAVLSPNQNLTSTPALTSTPTPESSSTPKLTSIPTSTLILTCDGISNTLKAELDGRLVESFNLVTDSDAYETVNGGESFDLIAAAQTDNNREKEIFINLNTYFNAYFDMRWNF